MLFGQRRTDSIRNEAQTRRGQLVQDIRKTKGRRRQTNKRRSQRRVGEGARTLDIAIRARITDQTEKTRRPESSNAETSTGARKSRKEYDLGTRQEERCQTKCQPVSIIRGDVNGRRTQGRPELWMHNLTQWFNRSTESLYEILPALAQELVEEHKPKEEVTATEIQAQTSADWKFKHALCRKVPLF
uniref:Uncharacterized protein n=1 Tax=Cacopsylla melanoneura TaxID=428564 RepID=A0A8D8R384_9HEMI